MTVNSKKYLFLSPINRWGGVNLDVAFLSHILSEMGQVNVISLGKFYKDSSVYYFDKHLKYDALDRLIYNNNMPVRLFTSLLNWVKPMRIPKHHRVANEITKSRLVNIEKIRLQYLERLIGDCNVLILCSHLTGSYMKEAIQIASQHKIPIIFRVTGHIQPQFLTTENKIWLSLVNCFIHHSDSNKNQVVKYLNDSNHVVIDQNAYNEKRFLDIPAIQTKITRFFTISRLHKLKGVDLVIQAFIKSTIPDKMLYIYGDGPELSNLKAQAKGYDNIVFYGDIAFEDIHQAYADNHCLIISSALEAGPYTGVEAMAAGRSIISTRVGAMESRLTAAYPHFYDGTVEKLEQTMLQVHEQSIETTQSLIQEFRKKYKNLYREAIIKQRYKEVLLVSTT